MRDRIATFATLLVPAVLGGLALAVWWPGMIAVGVIAAYVVAHVVVIPNPSGRVVPLVAAVAAGTALVTVSPVLVLGGAAVALPFGWGLIRLRHGRRVAATALPSEPIGLVAFSGVFFAGTMLLQDPEASHPVVLAVFGLAALAWFAATVLVRSAWSRERRTVTRRLVRLWALADWPAYAALFSSAALHAVTVESMGWWSLPLAGLPYSFSHLSLDRVQGTRRTYDQTIRALGAIPEASGQVADGHSGRTADLSIAVGSELGFGTGALRRLEYAALLHDIGRVVLSNPAVASGEYSLDDVSGWSAAIITEARYLEPVAEIVASTHAPYRKPGEQRDPSVPLGSQIVRIAARYDHAMDDGVSPVEAMELLHEGVAYDFDPEIVMALRRVLERRGEIAA